MCVIAALSATANDVKAPILDASEALRLINATDLSANAFKMKAQLCADEMAGLSPEAAADKWLELSDVYCQIMMNVQETSPQQKRRSRFDVLLSSSDYEDYNSSRNDVTLKVLVSALPPPAAWPRIREGLDARQSGKPMLNRLTLQILMACLTRDAAGVDALMQQVKDAKAKVNETPIQAFFMNTSAPQEEAAEKLKKWQNALETPLLLTPREIPDIMSLLTPEEAEEFFRKLFQLGGFFPSVEGAQTYALAQRIALEMADDLSHAYWSLVSDSEEGVKLYHIFADRFEPFEKNRTTNSDACRAVERAVVFTLEKGEVDEALNLLRPYLTHLKLKSLQEDTRLWRRENRIQPRHIFECYVRLFDEFPGLAIDDVFIHMALSCGEEAYAENLIRTRLKSASLTRNELIELRKTLATLLVASEQVEEAIKVNRVTIKNMKNSHEVFRLARDTADLAKQVGDHDTQNACLDIIVNVLTTNPEGSSYNNLFYAFRQAGREGEIPALLVERIVLLKKKKTEYSSNWEITKNLQSLLIAYVRLNRMEDAMTLLKDGVDWDDGMDVLDLANDNRWENHRYGINWALANALHETGHSEAAKQLLAEVMKNTHSKDWAYELLLKIAGDDLEGFIQHMDVLYARDAFEERPLIWKAEALRRLGRLDAAEEVIRLALKVDPTDGESGQGDRVRAYAVLGDILEAKGKPDDAQFFRDVVKAVRIAEEGDDLADLGFRKRSLEKYAEAETHFADAYCVQWRLAERFREMGQPEEARKHYEIAFERMPEQFGQVASLCFGCMGIFENAESVSAAESVLLRLVETPPVRPAVYYLMGQLREEQKRNPEACDWYVKALEADPNYLDVMLRLLRLKDKPGCGGVDWVALLNSVIRLDPLGRKSNISQDDILDWAVFWEVRDTALKTLPPSPEKIFPLTANAARIKNERSSYSRWTSPATETKPAVTMLASTRFVQSLNALSHTLSQRAAKSDNEPEAPPALPKE